MKIERPEKFGGNVKYSNYKELANSQSKYIFGGRLAQYKYYDMHQVIAQAIHDLETKSFFKV